MPKSQAIHMQGNPWPKSRRGFARPALALFSAAYQPLMRGQSSTTLAPRSTSYAGYAAAVMQA